MQKSFYFWSIALLFLAGTAVTSALVIFSVLPNTDDDANLEYIDLYNDSCTPIDLMGISLRDASKKTYTFSTEILPSWGHRKVMQTESKIILNNTNETIEILDASMNPMSQLHYATSQKNIPLEWTVQSPNCQVETTIEETTVEVIPVEVPPISTEIIPPWLVEIPSITDSWSTFSWSTVLSGTGEMFTGSDLSSVTGALTGSITSDSGSIVTSTGGIELSNLTGSISLGNGITVVLGNDIGTGATQTGATETNVTQTGVIQTQSGTSYSGVTLDWVTLSWVTLSWTTESGTTISSTGIADSTILIPVMLTLFDIDSNGKIDRLTVEYSGMLSGTLTPEKLIVFSASGGLADHPIETSSGVVKTVEYSGSTLIIDLNEQNLSNTPLKISNTTSSELRLKTLSWFWLTNVSGIPVLPLTFTQSFDGYDAKYIHDTTIPVIPSLVSNSIAPTPLPQNLSSPSGSSITPIRILPEPTIVFQSGLTAIWACKSASCRVNFIHPVQEKFEMCRWQVVPAWGTGNVIDGCNPRTITLGGSGGNIGLTILDSAGILPFKTKSFQILPFVDIQKVSGMENLTPKTPVVSKKSGDSTKTAVNVASEISKNQIVKPTKTATVKSPKKIILPTSKPKTPATKTITTKKTTTTNKTPSTPKAPVAKIAPIAPAYQKPQTPSDSVALGIIGIASAAIGFCLSLLRRKDPEPTN